MATEKYNHTNYKKRLVSPFDKKYHDMFKKEYDVDGTTALMIAADGGYEEIIHPNYGIKSLKTEKKKG